MLEVVSAALGLGILGSLNGFTAAKIAAKPLRNFLGHAVIFSVCFLEMKRRVVAGAERQHLWVNTLRTSRYVNDAIDTGAPTYLLANLPVMVASYSGCLATVGVFAFIFRR